jgi:hypothetical protein
MHVAAISDLFELIEGQLFSKVLRIVDDMTMSAIKMEFDHIRH